MRIYNFIVEPNGLTPSLSWSMDVEMTCQVRYGIVGSQVLTTTEALTPSGYSYVWSCPTLIDGSNYRFQVIAQSGETVISTPWSFYTAAATIVPTISETIASDPTLRPRNTSTGDSFASQLPKWSAMSSIPGTLIFQGTNAASSPIIKFTVAPTGIVPGMLSMVSDEIGAPYFVSQAPYISVQTPTNISPANTLVFTSVTMPGPLSPLMQCWPQDAPDDIYYIVAVDNTIDYTVTLEHSILNPATVPWCFQTTAILLSEPVATEHLSPTNWFFDTLGRRIIEGTARAINDVSNYISTWSHPYSINQLDPTQTWFGHRTELPVSLTQASDSYTMQRVASDFTSVVSTCLPPLYRANTLYDFLNIVAPTYLVDNTVVLFHNLQMVEEAVSLTTHDDTSTQTFNLSFLIQTSSMPSGSAAFIPDSNLYYFDQIYGWTLLPTAAYVATQNGTGTLITTYGTSRPESLVVRYNASKSWTSPYTQHVDVIANGTTLSRPRPHLLWNQYDELGLLIGIRRLKLEPTTISSSGATIPDYANATYESNNLYKQRLYAGSVIEPDPDYADALSWIALRLNLLSNLSWSYSNGGMTLPNNTTCVNLPLLNQTITLDHYPLLKDNQWRLNSSDDYAVNGIAVDTPVYRYYFSFDPDNEPQIFLDGIYVNRVIESEIYNTSTKAYYITLTAAEAKQYSTVEATYRVVVWNYADKTLSGTSLVFAGQYDVFATRDIDLTTFQTPDFASTLLDIYGTPNNVYRSLAGQLLSLSPILTNRAIWGQAAWFTSTDIQALPQLTRLPYAWI